MESIHNFIGNESLPASSGRWLDVHEPATGRVYARVAESGADDIEKAVTAARNAFASWARKPGEDRAAILNRIADLLCDNSDRLAAAESKDTGKPLDLAASVDIPRSVSNFRFFASAATQFSSESHAMGDHSINYTLRQPLGVVACISPWNLPLYLFTWKIAPALACGNTVVAKPSEITPATAAMFGEICAGAGLPPGVLNIVNGNGITAGAPLVEHDDIKAVSFTGSTFTGGLIAKSVATQFKKISLEMGGKNPAIVFADCDLERTVGEIVRAAYSNQGQICLCGSRILVQDSIYEDFKSRLLERLGQLRTGDPEHPNTDQGAIVSKAHHQKILGCLDLARQEGGVILCGGEVKIDGRCADGWFIRPVLIEGLANNCRTNQEEIFGPVATLQPFAGEREALALANDSKYGLACSIFSSDLGRCHRLAAQVECGIVWVNCWLTRDLRTPFGGMKSSGLGREGGYEAMRFFTEPRNVCIEFGHD
jgi:aminomuconate-semialdehyde/2-hydroxymuconate-6-semialdehyde dehydrogenase